MSLYAFVDNIKLKLQKLEEKSNWKQKFKAKILIKRRLEKFRKSFLLLKAKLYTRNHQDRAN